MRNNACRQNIIHTSYLLLQTIKIVGFYGDGYLEHTAYTLPKRNSVVSFSFRTMQEEAVLLLSTFEGQEERINNIRHMNEESNVRKVLVFSQNDYYAAKLQCYFIFSEG